MKTKPLLLAAVMTATITFATNTRADHAPQARDGNPRLLEEFPALAREMAGKAAPAAASPPRALGPRIVEEFPWLARMSAGLDAKRPASTLPRGIDRSAPRMAEEFPEVLRGDVPMVKRMVRR